MSQLRQKPVCIHLFLHQAAVCMNAGSVTRLEAIERSDRPEPTVVKSPRPEFGS